MSLSRSHDHDPNYFYFLPKLNIPQPDHRAGAAMHLAVTKGLCSWQCDSQQSFSSNVMLASCTQKEKSSCIQTAHMLLFAEFLKYIFSAVSTKV